MTEGTLEQIDGRPALRFTRHLPHPIERVWRAVTDHDELAAWFVAPMEFTQVGRRFEAMERPWSRAARCCASSLHTCSSGSRAASASGSTCNRTATAPC